MTTKKQAPHLLDEHPILVYPTLASAVGINKAVVFQQLHFLLNGQKTSKNEHNFVDDRWWVYNSYPEWRRDYFPWLSISSLKGIFNQLEDAGLVIARQSVKNKSDRRKWYTIDYEAWDKFCLTIGQKMSDDTSDKKCPIKRQKVANGYSETSTKTSTKTSTESKNAPNGAASPKPSKKLSYPPKTKDWSWDHLNQYADENPDTEILVPFDDMHLHLKELTTSAARDLAELHQELTRLKVSSDRWESLKIAGLKKTYNSSIFKCMFWALPNWLKGEQKIIDMTHVNVQEHDGSPMPTWAEIQANLSRPPQVSTAKGKAS